MPNLNGTGPAGQGPRTGRGLGPCGGGIRRGGGFGRRYANGVRALSKEEQKKILSKEKEKIEKELADLENDK
jgi:hypothetical protein